jgi:hypothetical protein
MQAGSLLESGEGDDSRGYPVGHRKGRGEVSVEGKNANIVLT